MGDTVVSVDEGILFPFYLYSRQQGSWPYLVSGHRETQAAWFESYEPLRNITESFPPTILLHGEADTDVPFTQSE